MTKFLKLLMICAAALLGLSSCSDGSEKAQECADKFIHAYYAAEFEEAAGYCVDDMKEKMMITVKAFKSLTDQIREKAAEIGRSTELSLIETIEKGEGCYTFRYQLERIDNGAHVRSSVTTIREGENWKVQSLEND